MKNQVIEDAKIGERIDDKLTQLKIKYLTFQEKLKQERQEYIQAENNYDAQVKAQQILTDTAHQIQQEVHSRIASVVSRCLESVFDEPYEFQINFEKKSNKTVAELVFVREGLQVDPISASGGGVVDVASFALRLACLVLRKPALRPILILDEPFRFVSKDYIPKVRDLIETLSEEMKIQIVMVTHIPQLQTGKVVEL